MTTAPPLATVGARRDPDRDPLASAGTTWSHWSWLLAVAAVVLAAGLRIAARDGLTGGEVVRAVVVVAWALAGLALVRRPSLQPAGVVVLAAVTASALSCLAAAAADLGWEGAAGDLMALVEPLGVSLLPAFGLQFLLGLPQGVLGTTGRRAAVAVGYGAAVITGAAVWAARPSLPLWPVWIGAAVAALVGVPASNRRYLASAGTERQRLQWLGCATVVVVEVALLIAALRLLAGWPDSGAVAAGAATALIPLSLVAGTRTRLVGRVDRILVHTVAVTGLTGVVVGVYLIVVLGLGRVPDDEERSILLLSIAAAGVAALLYPPARDRLSHFANNLVYGERDAPDELLRSFGSRLSRAIPLDELLLQLAESMRKGMRMRAAEVWTGGHGVLDRVVSVPERPRTRITLTGKELPVVSRAGVSGRKWAGVWLPSLLEGRASETALRIVPVTNSGELLGLLVVERAADEPFTEEEERALTELARQVGLALHNVQLDSALQASLDEVQRQADELRASRARIVATADAARRKIERDLHDGAQQQLVALAVNLRLARDLLGDVPEAGAMLDAVAGGLKEAIAELRNLAHGIYPPLLVDSGLGEALRAAANRSPVDVEVDAEGTGRYTSEVEAAIYFCCLEALQNVAKHAPDAHVVVRVREEAEALVFEVADDGPGFDVTTKGRGQGFTNMSDRLGSIGGRVRWESAPSMGTTISGTVPLQRPAAPASPSG